jgi:hypothetical protein
MHAFVVSLESRIRREIGAYCAEERASLSFVKRVDQPLSGDKMGYSRLRSCWWEAETGTSRCTARAEAPKPHRVRSTSGCYLSMVYNVRVA